MTAGRKAPPRAAGVGLSAPGKRYDPEQARRHRNDGRLAHAEAVHVASTLSTIVSASARAWSGSQALMVQITMTCRALNVTVGARAFPVALSCRSRLIAAVPSRGAARSA